MSDAGKENDPLNSNSRSSNEEQMNSADVALDNRDIGFLLDMDGGGGLCYEAVTENKEAAKMLTETQNNKGEEFKIKNSN